MLMRKIAESTDLLQKKTEELNKLSDVYLGLAQKNRELFSVIDANEGKIEELSLEV